MFDVIIVGAGPAGLSACLEAKKNNLNYLCLEQNKIANTIRNYPKGKKIQKDYMGVSLEKEGELFFEEVSREELIEKWERIVHEEKLNIKENDNVLDIKKEDETFKVIANSGEYKTKNVILAIGRMSSPRKLEVVGEDQNNVFYRLDDPGEYSDKNILVVGGGNSAIEAALLLSKKNKVTLSYRKSELFRLTNENQEGIAKNENVNVIFESNVEEINGKEVSLNIKGEIKKLEFDYVFILVGFNLPTEFLDRIGVEVGEGIESNIKGIYLIGDIKEVKNITHAINDGKKAIEVLKNGL